MTTNISRAALTEMTSWLEKAYPHEACGFMVGTEENNSRHVDQVIPVDNQSTENRRRRFVIDPVDYMKAERRADSSGLLLLGIFHSHPDHPAQPSEHDLASAQPYFSYLIATVRENGMGNVRSFRLAGNQFAEEELILET